MRRSFSDRVKGMLPRRIDRRKSSNDRGYDAAWQALRKKFLRANPMCCADGCFDQANEVDHKQTIESGGGRLDWYNLQGFCKSHHSQKTVLHDGGFGNKKKAI